MCTENSSIGSAVQIRDNKTKHKTNERREQKQIENKQTNIGHFGVAPQRACEIVCELESVNVCRCHGSGSGFYQQSNTLLISILGGYLAWQYGRFIAMAVQWLTPAWHKTARAHKTNNKKLRQTKSST